MPACHPLSLQGLLCLLFSAACALAPSLAAAQIQDHEAEAALIPILRSEASAYEHGEGVVADGKRSAELYCRAARLGDAESQFNLGWMYANGRGVERSDSMAAFFFNAAAEQGYAQAVQMLSQVGGPPNYVPDCMREPPAPVAVATPAPVPRLQGSAPKTIVDLVKKMAPEYRVQPQFALAIIEAESNFNVAALSPRNAKGLMQLLPETATRFNVRNPYDAAQNIRGGLAYLRWLLAYFEGDVILVAAAYNAGEATVERYRGVPPYLETRAYVARILHGCGALAYPYDASVTQPSAQLSLIRGRRGVM